MSDRNFWPSEAQFARLFIAVAGVAGQKTGRGRKYPDIRENVRARTGMVFAFMFFPFFG